MQRVCVACPAALLKSRWHEEDEFPYRPHEAFPTLPVLLLCALQGAMIQVPFTSATAPKLAEDGKGPFGILFMGSPRMSSLDDMRS